MKEIKPVGLPDIDFSPYGRWYELCGGAKPNSSESKEILERPYKLGITKTGAGSFDSVTMERHVSTEEVLLALDAPLVLVVAGNDPCGAPRTEDLTAVRMEPGQAVVLGKGIWHDACRCAGGKNSMYCFLAHNNGEPSELVWTEVFPEKVHVRIADCPEVPLQPETVPREDGRRLPGGMLYDVLANEKMTGTGWECWQTEEVCIPEKLEIAFAAISEKETLALETAFSGAFVLGASGQILVRMTVSGQSGQAFLHTGHFLRIDPGVSCTIAAPDGGSFYLLTAAQSK